MDGRIGAVRRLRYYLQIGPTGARRDPRCRSLGPGDLGVLQEFYRRYYAGTIFSAWMLDQPFFGIVEDGEIVAAGGVVAWHRELRAANLGNFLTRPDRRGKGLARAITATVLAELEELGFEEFTLGTYEENAAACRAYEAVGFRVLEQRLELDIVAAAAEERAPERPAPATPGAVLR
jgi:ribosomal protein S18 acetylase RimI-like enzyme